MVIKTHGTGSMPDNITTEELLIIQAGAKEQEAALIFLYGTDKAKYAPLWEELENACLGGQNSFPSTVDAAYGRLIHWANTARGPTRSFGPVTDGANFANCGVHSDGKQPQKDKSHITCFNCGEMGHYANKCKKEVQKQKKELTGDQHLTKGVQSEDSSNDEEVNFIFVSSGTEEYGTQLLSEQ